MKKLLIIFYILVGCVVCQGQVATVSGHCNTSTTGGTTSVTTASCSPLASGHAVLIYGVCSNTARPTSDTISASAGSWTFTKLVDRVGLNASSGFGSLWAAISPNTTATTFTYSCPAVSGGFIAVGANEFQGNDNTGGATTFYASNSNDNTTGGCSGSAVTSTSANDGVWAVCADSLAASGWAGATWTGITNDANGEGTEFKVANGAQTPVWGTTTGAFVVMSAAIKASGGGGAVPLMPPVVY